MDLKTVLKALVTVVLAAFAVLAVAAPASAQDTDDNQFRQMTEECRNGELDGEDGFFDGGLLGGTGAAQALQGAENAGGLVETLTGPARAALNGACNVGAAIKHPGDAIQALADKAWDGKLAGIVREIKDGNPAVISYTMSLWTKFKLDPEALELSATGVNNILWQGALIGLALSILIGLLKVASSRRQGSGEALEGAAQGYGRYLLYGALIPFVAIPTIWAFDTFADELVNRFIAPGGDFTKIGEAVTVGEEMHPMLVLIFVLISLIGSLAMCLALIMRIILLPILIGGMPLFAAWAIGRSGKFTVENATGVLISFALLKLAAALVYMSATWAALGLDGSEENKLISLVIFGAAGLCAPALVAVILPQMKGQAGGSAGALGGALMGATGAVVGGTIAAAGTAGGATVAGASAGAGAVGSGASALGLTGSGTGSSGGGRSGSGSGTASSAPGPSTGGGSARGGGSGSGGSGGSGPATGGRQAGNGLSSAGQTGARIARNAGGAAAAAMRASGGILDDSVGAPVHPGRAYR